MASFPETAMEYTPLHGTEIRLLKIKPNNGSGPLECHLVHHELNLDGNTGSTGASNLPPRANKPRYHAVSYVWGASTEKVPIIVNGCRLDVGKNLYGALFRIQRMFRSGNHRKVLAEGSDGRPVYVDLANSSRLIWVDAICINQEDIAEKSHQIPRMGDIYREAVDVITWLGEPDEEELPQLERWIKAVPIFCDLEKVRLKDTNSFQKVQFLCALVRDQNGEFIRSMEPVLGHVLPPAIHEAYLNGTLEEVFAEGDANLCSEAIFRGMSIFMSNEWFSRVWTVQEALLARGGGLCQIVIGDLITSYSAIAAVTIFMETLSDRLQNLIFSRFTSVISLTNLYAWFDVDNYLSEADEEALARRLNDLIRLNKDRKASSPHDHIYGLLGLLDASKLPAHLKPDYSRPFQQIWHEFMMFVVEKTGDLNRLCCSGRALDGVPNWVPDLRLTGKTLKTPLEESFVSFSADGQKIIARGVRLGTVVHLFVMETDCAWDFEDSRYWSDATTSYEACANQLDEFGKTILDRAKEFRACTDEDVFKSVAYGGWHSEWDIRDRYTTLGDLLDPRSPVDDGDENKNEQQRRKDCIALAKRLSDGPVLLTDTGLIVQDRHDGSRGFDYEEGVGGQLPASKDILCILMGSNWPWRLRPAGDEYALIGDGCSIVQEGARPVYDADYFEGKAIEEFIVG